MAESIEKLRRSGMISTKAFNALQSRTKVQRSKMAEFNAKKKDESALNNRGYTSSNEINRADYQRKGPKMSAGNPEGRQPTRDVINRGLGNQKKKFPAGGKMTKGGKAHPGVKGGVVPSAPSDYGGPSNRKYG